MRSSPVTLAVIAIGSTLALAALPAVAADEKKPDGAATSTSTSTSTSAAATDATPPPATDAKTTEATGTATTTTTTTSATVTPDKPVSNSDPREVEGETYYFIGARYRHTYLPTGILHLFVDSGPKTAVSIPSAGIEASMRKDNFEIIGAITYADYSLSEFPFKGKSESDTAYEIVKSNLKLINLSADFLWGTDFSPKFAFQYGVTAGLAVVLGDLHRNQAKPGPGGAGDPYTYVPCAGNGPKDNPGSGAYCDDSNDHYGDYTDKSWFNGGKKPNFYPIFGPMFAFRWKPAKQFVARVDAGFNLFSGFFFGLGLDYGI